MATPSATMSAITAAKKTGRRAQTHMDCTAVVSLDGEAGVEDREILMKLMTHAVSSTGLRLQPAKIPELPALGEYAPVDVDPGTNQRGQVRVLMRDSGEVDRLAAALHEQTIAVDNDIVGVRVYNAAVAARPITGRQRG